MSNIAANHQFDRTPNSNVQLLTKDNLPPPTPPKLSSSPSYSRSTVSNNAEKISFKKSPNISIEKEEEEIALKSPEVSVILFV